MTSTGDHPRHSYPGPQTNSAARPRRAAGNRRLTIWIVVVAVIVAIGVIGGVIAHLGPRPLDPDASQTATPPPRSGGQSFATAAAAGYWKITKTQWNDAGVRLNIEITVDDGTLYCAFSALDAAGNPLDPSYAIASDLRPGFVVAGETVVGTLTFDLPRQAMTLVMSDSQQVQLSALTVPG